MVAMAASQLRDLMTSERTRDGQIYRRIKSLNQLFSDKNIRVQIAEAVGNREFSNGTKSYRYLTFNFEKERKIVPVEVRFIKDHDNLSAEERIELGIRTDEDMYYFNSADCPSLTGVWFVNTKTGPSPMASDLAGSVRSLKRGAKHTAVSHPRSTSSIRKLKLGYDIEGALQKRYSISTIEELQRLSLDDLRWTPDIGDVRAVRVRNALKRHNRDLRQPVNPVPDIRIAQALYETLQKIYIDIDVNHGYHPDDVTRYMTSLDKPASEIKNSRVFQEVYDFLKKRTTLIDQTGSYHYNLDEIPAYKPGSILWDVYNKVRKENRGLFTKLSDGAANIVISKMMKELQIRYGLDQRYVSIWEYNEQITPAPNANPPKGSCADCLNSIISNDPLLDKALNEGFDIEADLKPARLKLKNPDQPFSDTTIYDREIQPLIDLGILIRT